MSAEPGKAKEHDHHQKPTDTANSLAMTITGNPTSGFGFNPSSGNVGNGGTVQFIAPQACWVWTFVNSVLTNVFNNQQSDHVACGVGANNNFTVASSASNTTFLVVGTAPNAQAPPPPSNLSDSLKGTIHVGT
jgi:hypothetical protein